MSDDADDLELDCLSDDFRQRRRRGEDPSIDEYAAKHPHLAKRIRDVFPGVVALEESLASSRRVLTSAGVRLGDYLLLQEIGRGGMGVVFEAEQASLDRRVALKVLSPVFAANQTAKARFQREARIAAKLHHTNIVPIFDVGEVEGVCYYSMQLLKGSAVDRLLAVSQRRSGLGLAATQAAIDASSAPSPDSTQTVVEVHCAAAPDSGVVPGLEIEPSARWAKQAAEALDYAHRHGIVHRDVKPSNLIVDDSGVLWIGDFGVARFEDDGLTRTGDVIGTLRYMAPERLRGDCGPSVDTFALGAALYEMLSGRPAFPAVDRLELLKQVETCEPAPLRFLAPHVPRDLETIVHKALEKEPGRRFTSAEAMAEDLRRFLAGETLLSRRPHPIERMVRFCKRRPAWATVIMLSILMLLGTAVASVRFAQETQRAITAERASKMHEADAYLAQANGLSVSGQQGQRFKPLEAIQNAVAIARRVGMPAEWFARARNEAIGALALPDITVEWPQPVPPNTGVRCAASPDHRMYLRLDRDGVVTIRSRQANEILAAIRTDAPIEFADFVRNDCIAVHTSGENAHRELWRFDANRRATERALLLDGKFQSIDLRPDGSLLAATSESGVVDVVRLPGCTRFASLPPGAVRREIDVAVHPTLPWIAMASYFGSTVSVRNFETGAEVVELSPLVGIPKPAAMVGSLQWSRDGNRLIVPVESRVLEYDFSGGRLPKRASATIPFVAHGYVFAFNPAEDRLVLRTWAGGLVVADRFGRRITECEERGKARHRWTDPELITAVNTNNEGGALVYRIADGREVRQITIADLGSVPLANNVLSFGPDVRIAASAPDGRIRLIDVVGERQVGVCPQGIFNHVRFAHDGSLFSRGASGNWHWPRRVDPNRPHAIVFGPPTPLRLRGANIGTLTSFDRDAMAEVCFPGYGEGYLAGLWYANLGGRRLRAFRRHVPASIAIRPDDGVLVWSGDGRSTVLDRRTGDARDLDGLPTLGAAKFLSDGRLLTSAQNGLVLDREFHRLGQMGEGSLLDANLELGLALYETEGGIIRVVDPGSGRELARLRIPTRQSELTSLSPDGRFLVALNSMGIRRWDLKSIGAKLEEIGLPWDLPVAPARTPVTDESPTRAEFVGLERLTPVGRRNCRFARDVVETIERPLDAERWMNLGSSLANADQLPAARAAYLVARILAPADPEAVREWAVVESLAGHERAALAALKSLATTHPADEETVIAAVAVALSQGAWRETVDLVRASPLTIDQRAHEARLLAECAAYALEKLGDSGAAADWRRRNDDQHKSLARSAAICCFGRLTDDALRLPPIYAVVLAEAGLRRNPQDGSLQCCRALALARLGRFADAERAATGLDDEDDPTEFAYWVAAGVRLLAAVGQGRATERDLQHMRERREREPASMVWNYPKLADCRYTLEAEIEEAFRRRRRL